ncbi:MAG TPA: OmpA family protein [Candidatus Akkermansia intestinavium]|nr:OmpA family protein [Candidatus Akkermansia intestinavium]
MPLPFKRPSRDTGIRPQLMNRRREGYELTRQRNMTPILLGAITGAIICHVIAYFYLPELVQLTTDAPDPNGEVTETTERLIVRKPPPDPLPEAQETEEEVQTAQEITQDEARQIEEEIDILDIPTPELTMAPGETSIPLERPEPTVSEPASEQLAPQEFEMSDLMSAARSTIPESVAEPAPINNNDVIVNSTPKDLNLDEADDHLDREMREAARESQGSLPEDTRSLTDLMGLKNLGESSGVARLETDVLFGFDECRLKNTARIPLLQLAALIYKNPDTSFIIEGHTDSRGSDEYNDLLSLQRAAAVREWLRDNHVPTSHVYIRACGSRSLLASASGSREEQAVNRRVEIHMRAKDEKLPPGCVPDTYPVDLKRNVSAQLRAGVRAPAAGASINPFEQARKTAKRSAAASGGRSSASGRSSGSSGTSSRRSSRTSKSSRSRR